MLRIVTLVLLILIVVSNTFSQPVTKLKYDTKELIELTPYIDEGEITPIDDSNAIINIGNIILMRITRSTGDVEEILDNEQCYRYIRNKISKYSKYDNVLFFEPKETKEIPTCNQFYINYRCIVPINENLFMTEIGIPLIKGISDRKFIDGILYFDSNFKLIDFKLLEFQNDVRYAVGWDGILFDRDFYYLRVLKDTNNKFYRKFSIKEGKIVDTGEFSEIENPIYRNLNMTREYHNLKNDSLYCMHNGEKVYCMEECYSGKKVKEFDLEVGDRLSYSNIIQIDDKDLYVAHKVLLGEYGGALFSWIELLDENFQKKETLLEWDIRKSPIISIAYFDKSLIMSLKNWNDKDVYIYEKEIKID